MPPGILTLIANFLLQWINPRVLAIGVTAIILVLPILQISGVRSLHLPPVLKKFYHNKLVLLNFLHRIGEYRLRDWEFPMLISAVTVLTLTLTITMSYHRIHFDPLCRPV